MSGFEEENQTQRAFGWAASDSSGTLHPFYFTRRANGENDITLKILYCGICCPIILMEFLSTPSSPGITVFSPMKFFALDKAGMHVGVVGLGGLGHLAVKFGKAFGMKMSVISTSPSKTIEAIEQLKADSFVVSHDMEQMEALLPLLNLLKLNGKLILLTPPDLHEPIEIPVMPLFSGRRTISASMAGGMKETQEMIDFAAKHNITANVEVISMDYVNKAMDRLAKGDVRYRFVIDAANTLNP
ncbi:hypothetical protein Pint_11233 [Pistacia integerrima]|uniref:Uncharacterized protein n=1 Tax=Pistacia integerrima TaxID=434235 RepID=A0ACC0XH68_9ROSI|nr:hypothetical protein Pint_11233 [Pistacia integerrima]